ncbi:unnamed protein product, partial [Allacma fusca]
FIFIAANIFKSSAATFNFLQHGKECNHTDAWSHYTMEQLMKDSAKHCDPRKLLICEKDSKGRATCQCGLVSAKYDSGRKACVPLAGAPCGHDGLFGEVKLKLEEANCDPSLHLICKKPFSSKGTYPMCECALGRADREGTCSGWKESGSANPRTNLCNYLKGNSSRENIILGKWTTLPTPILLHVHNLLQHQGNFL